MSDKIPEGDNIVGDRPADDKWILGTHLFLGHFTETGAGPHFTQMHLLFQLQAGGGSTMEIINSLGQGITFRPPFKSCQMQLELFIYITEGVRLKVSFVLLPLALMVYLQATS